MSDSSNIQILLEFLDHELTVLTLKSFKGLPLEANTTSDDAEFLTAINFVEAKNWVLFDKASHRCIELLPLLRSDLMTQSVKI